MFRYLTIFLCCIFHSTILTKDLETNFRGFGTQFWPRADSSSFSPMQGGFGEGRVIVQVFYEALCPACKSFIPSDLKQTVMELGPQLDVYLYPYGNAKTIPNWYGGYEFISQHGPDETYGNKLHACTIDVLQNMTSATLFNACLLESSQGKGSNDAAVDECGALLNVNTYAIKQCAKGPRGYALLKYHGDESKKACIKCVPTIIVNGMPSSHENFRQDVYRVISSNGRQSAFQEYTK